MAVALIEKYNESNFFWKRLYKKHPDLLQIIERYNGFEGNCLYYKKDDLIPLSLFQELKNKVIEQSSVKKSYNLLFFSENENIQSDLYESFDFIGYEYGFFKDEENIYSSVLNEIIWGKREQLVKYENVLNKSYLLPAIENANSYSEVHRQLKRDGEDVENDNEMRIFKVWKLII